MGERFAELVTSGPLLVGVVVAALAGLVSFLSPCVLPLVPGYLAYVTGLSGADLDAVRPPGGRDAAGTATPAAATATGVATAPRVRGRVLVGGLLFVAGFGAVFVTTGVLAAAAGSALSEHRRLLETGGGILMIVFGLALLGLVPCLHREVRLRWLPTAGLVGAPVFGAVFALSWIPCVGPTLAAVLALGALGGDPARAAVLAAAYTAGIGAPLLAFGLGLRWLVGALAAIRRHGAWVTRAGAALLILVGLALLTGAWDGFLLWLRGQVGVGSVGI
ncbi:MAG TPA: cytochrome c biogenesis CcdA family protein [Natronosporangium sp.]|nr:cytochrome c biogenesis CcdA family protein [Natronosporangium sp.]